MKTCSNKISSIRITNCDKNVIEKLEPIKECAISYSSQSKYCSVAPSCDKCDRIKY